MQPCDHVHHAAVLELCVPVSFCAHSKGPRPAACLVTYTDSSATSPIKVLTSSVANEASSTSGHHASCHTCLTFTAAHQWPVSQACEPAAAARAPSPSPAAPAMDLLGLDDLLGGTSLSPAPAAQPQQPPAPPPLQLRPQPQLSPQVFQQKWGTLPNMTKFQHSLSASAMAVVEANKHQVCACIPTCPCFSMPTLLAAADFEGVFVSCQAFLPRW